MQTITIDIETGALPCEQREAFRPTMETVKFGATKDAAKKEAKLADEIEKWERGDGAALSAATGEILLVCYAIDDGPVEALHREHYGEGDIISIIAHHCAGKTIVGHNVVGFDLPFINRRAMILGAPSIKWDNAYRAGMDDDPYVNDTMRMWQMGDRQEMIKLERLAAAFGYPMPEEPSPVTGAKFAEFWHGGEQEACIAYCEQDVEMTRHVYNRMMGAI